MLLMSEGKTMCRNMGNNGGVSDDLGVARTKVAIRLTVSVSLILPGMTISDQKFRRNFVGDERRRHLSTFRLGAFCAEAEVIALCMSCFGCSCQVCRLMPATLLSSKVQIRGCSTGLLKSNQFPHQN